MPSVFEQIKQIAAEEGAKRDQQAEQSRQAWREDLKELAKKIDTKGYRKIKSEATHKHASGQVQEVLEQWHKEIALMCQNKFTLVQIAKWLCDKAGFKISSESVRDYCDKHQLRQKKPKSGAYLKLGHNHDQIVAWVAEGKTRMQIADLLGISYRLVTDYIYNHQIGY